MSKALTEGIVSSFLSINPNANETDREKKKREDLENNKNNAI